MEQKNIFIEPNEEIVSVIDRLVESSDRQISLVIPRGAQIWQSSINLKLLKREVDNLGKEVTLIVSDSLEKETAERAGFNAKREKDFSVEIATAVSKEIISEESEVEEREKIVGIKTSSGQKELGKNKENMIGILVEEMKSEKEQTEIASSLNRKQDMVVSELARGKSDSDLSRFVSGKDKSMDMFSSKKPERKMVDIVNPEKVKVNFFRHRFLGEKNPLKNVTLSERNEVAPTLRETVISANGRVGVGLAKKRSKWPKFLISFVLLAVIASGVVAYLALPSVEITITPKTEKKTFDLSLVGTVSISRIDEVLNRIPLEEIKVIKSNSREFPSTGEKELSEKATGTITVYNEYSSSPQSLVATTRFESPDGKIFRIMGDVTIPGAKIEEGEIISSSIDVEVTADQPGPDHNIGPANFTIPGFKGGPKFASFYGRSKESMSGGLTGKVRIVLDEDLKKAEEALVEELKGEVSQALEAQIPSDLKILEGGIKEGVANITSSAKENERADKFSLSVDMVTRVMLYNEENLKDLIDLNLIAEVPEDKRPLSDTQKIKWGELAVDWDKGEAVFSLEVEEDLAWKIDTDKLKSDLSGKEEVEVRKYLANQSEIEKTKVAFWPFWVKKIPQQEKKIKIIVE